MERAQGVGGFDVDFRVIFLGDFNARVGSFRSWGLEDGDDSLDNLSDVLPEDSCDDVAACNDEGLSLLSFGCSFNLLNFFSKDSCW